MKDDFSKFFYWTIGIFSLGIVLFVLLMTYFSCGFTQDCAQGQPAVERTPLAVPPPASLPAKQFNTDEQGQMTTVETCQVVASELVNAWAAAGYPEQEAFAFTDADGKACEAAADEVRSVLVMAMPLDVVVSAGAPAP